MQKEEALVGFKKKTDNGVLYMEFGKLTKVSALEAAEAFKKSLDESGTEKAVFIARKGAKIMGPAFNKFSKEINNYEGDHLKALAIVLRNKAAKFIVEKMIKKDEPTDVRIFLDEAMAMTWLKEWINKGQSEIWLKENG